VPVLAGPQPRQDGLMKPDPPIHHWVPQDMIARPQGYGRPGGAPTPGRRPARRGTPWPDAIGTVEPLESQLHFLLAADRLKTVQRQSPVTDGSRRENSAEHSWHVALMAVVLAAYAPPGVDPARVMTMLLIHDLVEIDAGDLFVYADESAQARQAQAERAAADRLFAMLPPAQGGGLRALWDEFEERATPDARFARALDRLQPMLLNMVTAGGTWAAHGVTADQVLTKVALIEDGSPVLGAYARDMIGRAVQQGFLAPARQPETPR
jgi:putative hydrolase of HD superfamily